MKAFALFGYMFSLAFLIMGAVLSAQLTPTDIPQFQFNMLMFGVLNVISFVVFSRGESNVKTNKND